ncbi:cell division protein FtsA [Oceanobacillus halotolerans]|uniref:cell division protein FtsA n=1 Tax=Oceanobacillus halotolerans TaxID=2663380 RepID=UPI0013DA51D6|nr:pilus assembly protein PilM [Oceanobacillus halotolerans]
MEERIFALDIGTRSVTGIILKEQENQYMVVDYVIKEHRERSMRDGQIHHVIEVANVIKEVKHQLEETHGTLSKVSIAAAGRALKTIQATASIELEEQVITDGESIRHLELSAVQEAQHMLAAETENHDHTHYYCVGYSVMHYRLDDEQIGSLIDQSGKTASVEIIATFLPKIVVESLLAAVNRAGLEMEALTLEPIAAIHVLIPESMRRLNVALVDIGAGTSDIAITDKGTVVAYGMVPIAGDEITEAISDQYLLDFPMAEKMKRNIVLNGEDTVQDILGFESTITYDTLVDDSKDAIHKLASSIAREIIVLNTRSPKAVMVIGGGSLTPEITSHLAAQLQLPSNRVAVRDISAIQNLTKTEVLPTSPDAVTPVGIAIAAKQNPVHYINVTVNEKKIKMFEMKQLTIGDCLIQAGIDIRKAYGKPGPAIMITVNGKEITLPGTFGGAPSIAVNDELAEVDQIIQDKDDIKVIVGKDGVAPSLTLTQLIGETPTFMIYYNGKPYSIGTTINVNGEQKRKDYIIQDKDVVEWIQPKTVADFLKSIHVSLTDHQTTFPIYVNNREVVLKEEETTIYVNNEEASTYQPLKPNDQITCMPPKETTVKDILSSLQKSFNHSITVTFNGKPVTITKQALTILKDNQTITEDAILHPYDRITIKEQNEQSFIFQDVFRFIEVDLTAIKGNFQLYCNDEPTTFYASIRNGDQLAIK